MKKLGKVTILSTREYEALRRDLEDTTAALAWKRDNRLVECNIAFQEGNNAGKFHAAGGYGKALKATRAKLQETETLLSATASQRFEMQRLLEKWQPLVEALETTKGQFTETI